MAKGLKVSCQNIQHLLPKLDELKSNFSQMKNSEKPIVLGMCDTYLNSQKCIPNSNELNIPSFKDVRYSI